MEDDGELKELRREELKRDLEAKVGEEVLLLGGG